MRELVFEVMQEADGGYTAEALGERIFTQADSWNELKANVREAVRGFYFDSTAPASVRFSQKALEGSGAWAPSLRDSGWIVGFANPTLKRGANNHCAYGAGSAIDLWPVCNSRAVSL